MDTLQICIFLATKDSWCKFRKTGIDPVAFMVVATVDEVSGRGYTIERH